MPLMMTMYAELAAGGGMHTRRCASSTRRRGADGGADSAYLARAELHRARALALRPGAARTMAIAPHIAQGCAAWRASRVRCSASCASRWPASDRANQLAVAARRCRPRLCFRRAGPLLRTASTRLDLQRRRARCSALLTSPPGPLIRPQARRAPPPAPRSARPGSRPVQPINARRRRCTRSPAAWRRRYIVSSWPGRR